MLETIVSQHVEEIFLAQSNMHIFWKLATWFMSYNGYFLQGKCVYKDHNYINLKEYNLPSWATKDHEFKKSKLLFVLKKVPSYQRKQKIINYFFQHIAYCM